MIKEACVETFEEAVAAEKLGANRIELCTDLASDGLTPPAKLLLKTCAAIKIPVMVMIRPRAGNFVYSEPEISQMKSEIDAAKKAGAAGVVFGCLTTVNTIDVHNTRLLADYAKPLDITFHKAINELNDPAEGIKVLKEIPGITRILTSGGKPTAKEGITKIREMLEVVHGKPIILLAGKVTRENVNKMQKLTGAPEFHGRKIVGNL